MVPQKSRRHHGMNFITAQNAVVNSSDLGFPESPTLQTLGALIRVQGAGRCKASAQQVSRSSCTFNHRVFCSEAHLKSHPPAKTGRLRFGSQDWHPSVQPFPPVTTPDPPPGSSPDRSTSPVGGGRSAEPPALKVWQPEGFRRCVNTTGTNIL